MFIKAFLRSKLNIFELYPFLKSRRKFQLIIFTITMILSAICESFTIASLIPFISVLADPDNLSNNRFFKNIIDLIGLDYSDKLLLPLTVIFCFAIFFSGLIRVINIAFSNKLSALIGSDLSCACYEKTLYQPYVTHLNRNTSKIISTITDYVSGTITALNATLQMLTSFFIALFLSSTLFALNVKVATTVILIITIFYSLIYAYVQKRFKKNSFITSNSSKEQIKYLQEGLGAVRDVLLDGSQIFYLKKFRASDKIKRLKQGENQFLSAFPKFALESIGILLITIIAYRYSNKEFKNYEIIPLLGALALGSQKLLPACQQVYLNWSTVKGYKYEIDGVLNLLKQKIEDQRVRIPSKKLNFKESIIIRNLNFSYNTISNFNLKNINLQIDKGDRVGIIGKTGSGKSTLVDIIMGLIPPDSGEIIMDGINLLKYPNNKYWRSSIAHVPQNIFLTDASIKENIALGIEKNNIDYNLVKICSEKAQLHQFIKNLSNGYDTHIGERGVKLSGGQKQRIGIARALYKKSKVLFLDEATSALDNKTEKDFLKAIDNLSKETTLIIVAHRLTTIEKCNKIIELKDGETI